MAPKKNTEQNHQKSQLIKLNEQTNEQQLDFWCITDKYIKSKKTSIFTKSEKTEKIS